MDLRKILRESINKVLNENIEGYEEYLNDYPSESFSKENVSINDLLSFIKTRGDILYYINGRFRVANSQEILDEITNEIQQYGATVTNDLDEELEWEWDRLFGNDNLYVAVFLVQPRDGIEYYIIYENDKY